jgi:hypothetical protein
VSRPKSNWPPDEEKGKGRKKKRKRTHEREKSSVQYLERLSLCRVRVRLSNGLSPVAEDARTSAIVVTTPFRPTRYCARVNPTGFQFCQLGRGVALTYIVHRMTWTLQSKESRPCDQSLSYGVRQQRRCQNHLRDLVGKSTCLENHRLLSPMRQVPAGRMAPGHCAPGIVAEAALVDAIFIRQPVGIGHPIVGWAVVELGPRGLHVRFGGAAWSNGSHQSSEQKLSWQSYKHDCHARKTGAGD